MARGRVSIEAERCKGCALCTLACAPGLLSLARPASPAEPRARTLPMTKELLKGNEAIAEAAVRAGLEAYFGYPITPQTEILEYLSRRMPELGRTFVHAESEMGAS